MDKPLWMWVGFLGIILCLLAFDLGLLNRKEKEISVAGSLQLSCLYIFVSLCFGIAVFHYIGPLAGKDFFTGYLIEKTLSIDNIFVISLVFSHFYIPRRYQYRVLFWGILGAVLLRGLMIGVGSMLIQEFHFILYGFGAFLIFTGARMLFVKEGETNLKDNKMLQWLERHMPVTASLHGSKFFALEKNTLGKMARKATPLLLVLVFIELADIVFAVDSVPAVFAITTDPFIVYTSNIFAILGLRALYFALSAMIHRFEYLKYSLALILVFIGSKIFLVSVIRISSGISLAVTLALIAAGVLVSLYKTKKS